MAFLAFIQDVHAIGLEAAQGLRLVEAFYWDMDDGTRAFARRFAARMGGRYPSTNQAGVYSATLAYLNAVSSARSDDAREAVPVMKRAGTVRDPLFGDTSVRADGRTMRAMHLFEVKRPGESRAPYDYYRLVRSIPTEEAFRPPAEGGCPLTQGRYRVAPRTTPAALSAASAPAILAYLIVRSARSRAAHEARMSGMV